MREASQLFERRIRELKGRRDQPPGEILRARLPELPNQKRARFRKEYGVDDEKLEIFIRDKALSEFFEQAVSEAEKWAGEVEPKKIIELSVNYITSDLSGLLKEKELPIAEIKTTPENFPNCAELTMEYCKALPVSKSPK